jgi:hypothetical protein
MMTTTTSVRSEQYTFDFANVHRPVISSGTEQQPLVTRMIQTTDNSEPCYYEGAKLVCEYSFATGYAGNETMITFLASCDIDARYNFDYRRATNCACMAQITPIGESMKECPCTVCATGFGDIPVSVDCGVHEEHQTNMTNGTTATSRSEDMSNTTTGAENGTAVDPYIFGTCTSIDCSGACNGTCAVNCDASGTLCSYCVDTPTSAPTGLGGNGDIKNLGEETSSAPVFYLSTSIGMVVVVGTVAFALVSTITIFM